MKNLNRKNIKKSSVVISLCLLLTTFFSYGQELKQPEANEVRVQIASAEVLRFDKPIRIGPGDRAIEYQEAMVYKVMVNPKEFDALPPSIEPFLYIGTNEYRIYHIDRAKGDEMLILTFHIRNWEQIKDGEPIVLTTEHGDPVRNARIYRQRKLPRFSRAIIADKRKQVQ